LRHHGEFVVAAPLERTWEALIDIERVARCVPGATVEPVGEDGLYRLSAAGYGGTLRLLDVDTDEHAVSLDARGSEVRGSGTASATVVSRLAADGDTTRVRVETDLALTGRPAEPMRGTIDRLIDDFAERLEQFVRVEPPADAGRRTRVVLGGALVALVLVVALARRLAR
jgi:carbon monoxide dehydrogenase subunit G